MATSSEVLSQLVDQYVALASLVRQLIATRVDDSNQISALTKQITEKDSTIAELISSDAEVSEKAASLSNEIQALIVEASAAIPQPV